MKIVPLKVESPALNENIPIYIYLPTCDVTVYEQLYYILEYEGWALELFHIREKIRLEI